MSTENPLGGSDNQHNSETKKPIHLRIGSAVNDVVTRAELDEQTWSLDLQAALKTKVTEDLIKINDDERVKGKLKSITTRNDGELLQALYMGDVILDVLPLKPLPNTPGNIQFSGLLARTTRTTLQDALWLLQFEVGSYDELIKKFPRIKKPSPPRKKRGTVK